MNIWLAEFHDDVLDEHPAHMVAFAQAMVLAGDRPVGAVERARRSEDRFDDHPDEASIVDAYLAAFKGRVDEAPSHRGTFAGPTGTRRHRRDVYRSWRR